MGNIPSIEELKKILKNEYNKDRYEGFTVFDVPVKFNEYFAGRDFEVVQLHSIQTYHNGECICGFCGQISWKNNILKPLDGDSYSEKMTVYGYEEFSNEEEGITHGLDILVGTDW